MDNAGNKAENIRSHLCFDKRYTLHVLMVVVAFSYKIAWYPVRVGTRAWGGKGSQEGENVCASALVADDYFADGEPCQFDRMAGLLGYCLVLCRLVDEWLGTSLIAKPLAS